MAMCKAPRHRGGHPPPAGRLCQYLVAEEQREQVWAENGQGREIDAEAMVANLGGYRAQHWHGIVAPSAEECRSLIDRYGSLEAGARRHAQTIGAEIALQARCPRPNVAIHLERDHQGNPRFHFHYVGMGPCPSCMFGERGFLQRAWNHAWIADRKPIQDWDAHRRFLDLRGKLRNVVREQRDLARTRQGELRGTSNHREKQSIRDRHRPEEVRLIHDRHHLERAACDARYQARRDVDSPSHRAESQGIDARREAALGRLSARGQSRHRLGQLAYRLGRALSAAKRVTKQVLNHRLPLSLERQAHRLVGHSMERQPRAFRVVARRSVQVSSESFRLVRQVMHRAIQTLTKIGRELMKAGAKLIHLGAKVAGREAVRASKVTLQVSLGVVAAIPTLGGSLKAAGKETLKDAGEAARNLGRDGMEGGRIVGKHATRSAIHAGEAALSVAGDALRSAGTLGLSALPRPLRHGFQATKEASRAALLTSKDLLCLDLYGAAVNAAEGTFKAATAASRSVFPIHELPTLVRIPFKAAEMVPLIGLPVKVVHFAAKALHGLAKEIER